MKFITVLLVIQLWSMPWIAVDATALSVSKPDDETTNNDMGLEVNEKEECANEPTPQSCPSADYQALVEESTERSVQHNDINNQKRRYPYSRRESPISDTCKLVWAPKPPTMDGSSASHDDGRGFIDWGVFSMINRTRGTPILPGDVVIQVVDASATIDDDEQLPRLHNWIESFWMWPGQETGGQYEGELKVQSLVPGLGMLTNTVEEATATKTIVKTDNSNEHIPPNPKKNNILPFVPQVDEGGLTRQQSPGAGAISHYHNYTWYVQRPIEAGEELLISNQFHYSNQDKDTTTTTATSRRKQEEEKSSLFSSRLPLEYLREYGYCLDNIMPTKRKGSKLKYAGRGALAARPLAKGSLVAPVPVLPIPESLLLQVSKSQQFQNGMHQQVENVDNTPGINLKQLLLNYCYRPSSRNKNTTSSAVEEGTLSSEPSNKIWLFPYSPHINLINHYPTPNVRLQWSQETIESLQLKEDAIDYASIMALFQPLLRARSLEGTHQKRHPLVLELVALRDIPEGEELFLDYGPAWEESWYQHVAKLWKPINEDGREPYAPAYVIDDSIRLLRTQKEQKDHPYPDNVQTSCFYRYQDHAALVEERLKEHSNANNKDEAITTYRWNMTRGIYDVKHLRPCSVVRRSNNDKKGRKTVYAVQILNRPGLHSTEVVPPSSTKNKPKALANDPIMHIVTHVPRSAIRFTDKPYTTDTHLSNAFRHDIGFVYGNNRNETVDQEDTK